MATLTENIYTRDRKITGTGSKRERGMNCLLSSLVAVIVVVLRPETGAVVVVKEKAIVKLYEWQTLRLNSKGKMAFPEKIKLRISTETVDFILPLMKKNACFTRMPVVSDIYTSGNWSSAEFLKDVCFYQNLSIGAFFSITAVNQRSFLVNGCYETNRKLYCVKPEANSKNHWLLKHTERPSMPDSMSRRLENQSTKASRRRRQSRLLEIELLLVVDYSLFKRWYSVNKEKPEAEVVLETIQRLVHHYALIVHGVDVRFKNIPGTRHTIDVIPIGIFISQDANSSSWTEEVKKLSDGKPIVSAAALSLLSDWTVSNRKHLPNSDHAMGFTAYNLVYKDNMKTLGLGYKQSMCSDRSFSIIEDHGNIAYVSYIAAHELAHSLGARHDGMPATVKYGDVIKTCYAEDSYVMSPKTSRDPDFAPVHLRQWRFSECSSLYFDFYIDYMDTNRNNCLSERGGNTSLMLLTKSLTSMQAAYSPDEQCAHAHGARSVLARRKFHENPSDICRSIPCTSPRNPSITIATIAMDGTKCGVNSICFSGICRESQGTVETENTYRGTSHCIFGDQPGVIQYQKTCLELVGSNDKAMNCYSYDKQCCGTCANHQRKYTSLPGCLYGDRIQNCNTVACPSDECCETCARMSGNLTECPLIVSPDNGKFITNTDTTYHGTVATFTCNQGYILNGSESSTCLVNGKWSSSVPTCYFGCPRLQIHPHVLVIRDKGDYSVGAVVNFRCDNGLLLKGDITLVCNETSQWNGTEPSCELDIMSPPNIRVQENLVSGTIVHRVSTGQAPSTFSLISYSHPGFNVMASGDVIISDGASIDFEEVSVYMLNIQAVSQADERLTAHQMLTVLVDDVNEFPPEFDRKQYCASVHGNQTKDDTILYTEATDRDGYCSNVTYSIAMDTEVNITEIVKFDHKTARLSIAGEKLPEQSTPYELNLMIIGVDKGCKEELTGSASVRILVGSRCAHDGAGNINSFIMMYCVYFNVFHAFMLNI